MDWEAFAESVSNALPTSQYNQVGHNTSLLQFGGTDSNFGELYYYSDSHGDNGNDAKQKQSTNVCTNRKEKIRIFFLWVGKRSLEIYMIHGLLLNILKSDVEIKFSSIEGYLLTAGNFTLTIGLCVVVISLLNQNTILKKIFNIR